MSKQAKRYYTVFVWNGESLHISYHNCTLDEARNWAKNNQITIQSADDLTDGEDDPRWQVVEGALSVQVVP